VGGGGRGRGKSGVGEVMGKDEQEGRGEGKSLGGERGGGWREEKEKIM